MPSAGRRRSGGKEAVGFLRILLKSVFQGESWFLIGLKYGKLNSYVIDRISLKTAFIPRFRANLDLKRIIKCLKFIGYDAENYEMKNTLLISLLFVTACASHSAKTVVNPEYVSGNPTANAATLRKNLSAAGGPLSYTFSVTLLTEPLLRSEVSELSKKNMETAAEQESKLKEKLTAFLGDKTCFHIQLVSIGSIDTANFNNWKFKVEQSASITEAAARNVSGMHSVPQLFTVSALGSTWTNNTYACTSKKMDLSKDFTIHAIPQWENAGLIEAKAIALQFIMAPARSVAGSK